MCWSFYGLQHQMLQESSKLCSLQLYMLLFFLICVCSYINNCYNNIRMLCWRKYISEKTDVVISVSQHEDKIHMLS